MPTDSDIEALAVDLEALGLAFKAANNLCDILAIELETIHRWLSFCGSSSPALSTPQAECLLDLRVAFDQQGGPTLHALLNRPGTTPGFSRNLLGRLRPAVNRLPRRLRRSIASLPDHTLRLTSYATNLLSKSLIGVAILDSFIMTNEDAASFLQMSLPEIAIRYPGVLAALPERVKAYLSAATAPQLWFTRDHHLFAEFSGRSNSTIIDMGRAEGRSRLDLLRSIVRAIEGRSTAAVRDAIRLIKAEGWFFATSDIRDLPTSDFSNFDGTLSFATILRKARTGSILYDTGEYAILDHAAHPNRRYFLRFPSSVSHFVEQPSDEHVSAYKNHPLSFALSHSAERARSAHSLALRTEIDLLESFRREVALARSEEWLKKTADGLSRAGLESVPQAAFTAAAYLLVARQLGIHDSSTIAALEGFVHLLLRTLSQIRKSADHA